MCCRCGLGACRPGPFRWDQHRRSDTETPSDHLSGDGVGYVVSILGDPYWSFVRDTSSRGGSLHHRAVGADRAKHCARGVVQPRVAHSVEWTLRWSTPTGTQHLHLHAQPFGPGRGQCSARGRTSAPGYRRRSMTLLHSAVPPASNPLVRLNGPPSAVKVQPVPGSAPPV